MKVTFNDATRQLGIGRGGHVPMGTVVLGLSLKLAFFL